MPIERWRFCREYALNASRKELKTSLRCAWVVFADVVSDHNTRRIYSN
jgi:hypothetical protein